MKGLLGIFKKTKCEKLVRYQGRIIKFKGVSAKYNEVNIDLGTFNTEIKKIEEASELLKAIDDFQYYTCMDLNNENYANILTNEQKKQRLEDLRKARAIITNLRTILSNFTNTEEQQKLLNDGLKQMKKFVDSTNR